MELSGIFTFKDRLRRRRVLLGYTQKELAARIVPHVHEMMVTKWESGKTEPRNVAAVARALNVPVKWLMTGEGPEPPES